MTWLLLCDALHLKNQTEVPKSAKQFSLMIHDEIVTCFSVNVFFKLRNIYKSHSVT